MFIDNHKIHKSDLEIKIPSVFTVARKYGTPYRTMTESDFRKVYDEVFAVVSNAFKKQRFFAATTFILQLADDGRIGYGYPADVAKYLKKSDTNGKSQLSRDLNALISIPTIDFVVLVTEAWAANLKADEKFTAASTHPQRKEVLMFNLISKDCQAIAVCEINRNDSDVLQITDKPSLEFIRNDSDSTGRFIRPPKRNLN